MTRTSSTRLAVSAQSSISVEVVDQAPRFQTREERLGTLVGSLALRAYEWRWAPIYERWRAGKPVSPFQRKFLAVSSHYRALAGERVYDHIAIASIRALPERSR
jgi:hypothetical protein